MLLQPKSKAKVLMFDKSHEDNLPSESTAAEMDVSNSVIVDAIENDALRQREYEVQAMVEAGNETSQTLVGSNKVDKNKIDAAKEAERGLQEAKEGEEPGDDDDDDNGGEEEEEDTNEYDDDKEDDIDVDYDEDPEEYDDNNVDDDEDPDEYDDDNIDDYADSDSEDFDEDDDYDDEKDGVMEEEEIDETKKLENNDNTVEENDDNKRNAVEEGKKQEKLLEENEEREGGCLKEKVKILTKESERKNERNKVEEGKKQENAKEENEEREGGSLKKKVKISRKGSKRKKDTTEVSDRVASELKDKQGDAMEEAEQGNGKKDIQDKEGSHRHKVKKLSKSTSSKVATGGSKKVASKRDNNVESSPRKRFSKKVKSMGMIFMCSSKTKRDCYHYKVLGLPANKRDIVGKIYKGMRLFLYDFDLKLMYGIYKAAGPGGYKIQPRAFNSQFPSQVRFTVLEDCLPLAQEKFKKVIKDNYYTKTKFDCQLTSLQVKNLCKLFVSASKRAKSEVLAKRLKTCASADQNRSRARERQSAMDEKHRYREYSSKRKREVVTSQVAPVTPGTRLLVPPAAATPSYAYDRTLEMDAYEQDLLLKHCDSHRRPIPVPEPRRDAYMTALFSEHHDVYRRDPLLDRLHSYREDDAVEQHDLRSRDEFGRHDPYISCRERPEHRDLLSRDDFRRCDPGFTYRRSPEKLKLRSEDGIRRRHPYISYRERTAYWDRVCGTGSLSERDHYHPLSQSTEYHSAVAPLPEYRSARPLHRY